MTDEYIDKEFLSLEKYMKFYIELLMYKEKNIPSFECFKNDLFGSPFIELYYVNGKEHCAGQGIFDWAMTQDWIRYRHYRWYLGRQVNVTEWTFNKNK